MPYFDWAALPADSDPSASARAYLASRLAAVGWDMATQTLRRTAAVRASQAAPAAAAPAAAAGSAGADDADGGEELPAAAVAAAALGDRPPESEAAP